MKNPTTIVTAVRDRTTGVVAAIVDEDGKSIPVGGATPNPAPVAVTANVVLTAADNGKTFYNNTATARTVTFPAGLPAGFGVALVQKAAGALTAVAGAGATVTSKDGFTKTNGANSTIAVSNSGLANDYLLTGQGVA